MKKEKIKPLPFVKEFVGYFVRRAKRALKLKNSEFKTLSMDVSPHRGNVWVWFYDEHKVIARTQFHFDGQCYDKHYYRKEEIETEVVTQGKPEDA